MTRAHMPVARADDLSDLPPVSNDVGGMDIFATKLCVYARRLTVGGTHRVPSACPRPSGP
jgi:hypothetical protein